MSSRPNSPTAVSTRRFELVELQDVGGDHQGAPPGLLDQARHLGQVGLGPRRQHDVGARLGQADRDAPPDAEPGAGDDGHPVVEAEPVEDHAVARPRRRGAGGPARHQRHVEVRAQPRLGLAHVGHRVDAVHRRGHDAAVALEPRLDRVGVQLAERDQAVGVAGDLDLEVLAVGSEAPGRVQVLLAHEPVHRGGDDRLAVDQSFPAEALGGDQSGLNRADGGLDRRGGHRHLVRRAQFGVEVEAELVGHHVHRLAEPGPERLGHDALA